MQRAGDGGALGQLRLAGFSTAASALLPPVAVASRVAFPGSVVQITEADPEVCHELLLAGQVDLAVVVGTDPLPATNDGRFEQRPLLTDTLDLLVPSGHRLAREDAVTLADAAGEEWIMDSPGKPYHQLAVSACTAAGFTPDPRPPRRRVGHLRGPGLRRARGGADPPAGAAACLLRPGPGGAARSRRPGASRPHAAAARDLRPARDPTGPDRAPAGRGLGRLTRASDVPPGETGRLTARAAAGAGRSVSGRCPQPERPVRAAAAQEAGLDAGGGPEPGLPRRLGSRHGSRPSRSPRASGASRSSATSPTDSCCATPTGR